MGNLQRKLVSILCADIEGYSHHMRLNEEATFNHLNVLRLTMDTLINKHNGRVANTAGDSVLAEFNSVYDAVECAVNIQQKHRQINQKESSKSALVFRIGINLGDVLIKGDDILGDGVNIAARLEGIADTGGICLSGAVYDCIKNKLPFDYEYMGEKQVKNIEEPIRTYRVLLDSFAKEKSESRKEWTPLQVPEKPSIAVLPFDNMSNDPEQEYFSDGMTEDIITDLSKLSGLFVIARNSTFSYKGRSVNIRQIGGELGVKYVLEGSVRKAGQKIRITAQLLEASTGHHLWAERYDRDLDDIFVVQDEITQTIVGALELELTRKEKQSLQHKGNENIEAHDLLLKGKEKFYLFSKEGVTESIKLFEQAIRLAPDYTDALVWRARALTYVWICGWNGVVEETLMPARESAEQAIQINNNHAPAHAISSWVHLWRRNHDVAIQHGERAIELDSNNADAHLWLSFGLTATGRLDEALLMAEKAMRLNPHYDPPYLQSKGMTYFAMGRYLKCARVLEECKQRNNNFLPAHVYLAAAYHGLDRMDEARQEILEVLRINPGYHSGFLNIFINGSETHQRLRKGLQELGIPDKSPEPRDAVAC